ncbi:MAG: trypsin-like peptidase domain-containing protein [Stigonema ocellatum SAG 48.90 = DSM 106950]|nr:trypsin-like peptidase domain-containing protein [Stigonema ocellatum SAG 48.90 = DSM 106950]
MINLLSKYSIALVSLAIVIGQTQAAIAQNVSAREGSDVKVENIAKGITVRITTIPILLGSGKDDQPIASGVLIKKNDNTYFVLTNKHVVEGDYEYRALINIPDSDKFNPLEPEFRRVKLKPVGKYGDLDIALLTFENPENNSEKYRFAVLGDSTKLQKNARISVGGYPKDPSAQGEIFRVAPLKITEIEDNVLIYSPINLKICQPNANKICNAEPGMSGGPILNDQGELIGIHKGTTDLTTDKNQGIPIKNILDFFTEIPKETSIANEDKPKVSELLPISQNPLIASPILVNQTPANQPFTKLFRPPVIGGF